MAQDLMVGKKLFNTLVAIKRRAFSKTISQSTVLAGLHCSSKICGYQVPAHHPMEKVVLMSQVPMIPGVSLKHGAEGG